MSLKYSQASSIRRRPSTFSNNISSESFLVSDCRFGVSPVKYPDPDPDTDSYQMSHIAFIGGGNE